MIAGKISKSVLAIDPFFVNQAHGAEHSGFRRGNMDGIITNGLRNYKEKVNGSGDGKISPLQ
jgi:hypothetical protein